VLIGREGGKKRKLRKRGTWTDFVGVSGGRRRIPVAFSGKVKNEN